MDFLKKSFEQVERRNLNSAVNQNLGRWNRHFLSIFWRFSWISLESRIWVPCFQNSSPFDIRSLYWSLWKLRKESVFSFDQNVPHDFLRLKNERASWYSKYWRVTCSRSWEWTWLWVCSLLKWGNLPISVFLFLEWVSTDRVDGVVEGLCLKFFFNAL